ncbi:hypothetical protein F5146DRAFT_484884 [Armillaria mellea]|nr:hypothetical protein F5146DRAFT_484884 [Armillaria mellea]
MASPTFQDFLDLGLRQRFSCRELVHHIRSFSFPTIQTDVWPVGPVARTYREGQITLSIGDPWLGILRTDPYFLELLKLLKDERIPINTMQIYGFNPAHIRNWSALISGFSSFPHICDLQILGVDWSQKEVRDIVASLPNLRFLTLVGWRACESSPTQAAEDWPQGGRDLPHLEMLHLQSYDEESAPLEIFDGSGYPANVQGLELLTIHGHESEENDIVSCDDAVIQRIQAFLHLLVIPPEYLSLGNFRIDTHLILDVSKIEGLCFKIPVCHSDLDDWARWLADIVHAIPVENNIKELMIEFEVDWYTVSEIPPDAFDGRENRFWASLDRDLCRPHMRFEELSVKFYMQHPDHEKLYDLRQIMNWICVHCLPRSRSLHDSAFKLFDTLGNDIDYP